MAKHRLTQEGNSKERTQDWFVVLFLEEFGS